VAATVLSVILFLIVFFVVRGGGSGSDGEGEVSVADGGSGNVIMLGMDTDGRPSQLLVYSPEDGGNLLTVPVRTIVDTTDRGFARLDEVYQAGGQEALDQAVADLLQIPIQYHIFFPYAAVELTAERAGTINIKTARPLVMSQGPQGVPVTIPTGDNPTGASAAVATLKAAATDNGDGPSVQAAFYQGLRDALSNSQQSEREAFAGQLLKRVETDMDEGDFVGLFVAATAPGGAFSSRALPVKAAGEGEGWYFEPVLPEAGAALPPADAGLKLEIQNGTGQQGVVEAAAAKLEPLGFGLTLKPEPSGVNFDTTQIRCGTEALEGGSRVRDLLGGGTVIKDEYMEKNLIIVIMGRDTGTAVSGQG
jgi:anionic cell wall polymer biosynthesis LytR-Cps2A-Psr (LCP) family protein